MKLTNVIRQARQSVLRLSFQTNSIDAITEVATRAEELATAAQLAGFDSLAKCGVQMTTIVRTAASNPAGLGSEHLASLHGLLREAISHQAEH